MLARTLAVGLAILTLATAGCCPGAGPCRGGVEVEVVGPATPVTGASYPPGDIPTHLPPAHLPPPPE